MLVTIAVLLDGSTSKSEKLMALNSELCSMNGRTWLIAEKLLPLARPRNCISAAGRTLFDSCIIVHRQADLLQVVDALDPPGRLACRLHGGQQQGDQDRDDRDHDQKLDQGESGRERRIMVLSPRILL